MMRYKPMLAYPVSTKPIDYDKGTWISIFELMPFEDQVGECIFVGKPNKLIAKYDKERD